MSGIPAGSLLRTYLIKQNMARDGVTNPSAAGLLLFDTLVERLSQLDSDELILIQTEDVGVVTFTRESTGEVLATVDLKPITSAGEEYSPD